MKTPEISTLRSPLANEVADLLASSALNPYIKNFPELGLVSLNAYDEGELVGDVQKLLEHIRSDFGRIPPHFQALFELFSNANPADRYMRAMLPKQEIRLDGADVLFRKAKKDAGKAERGFGKFVKNGVRVAVAANGGIGLEIRKTDEFIARNRHVSVTARGLALQRERAEILNWTRDRLQKLGIPLLSEVREAAAKAEQAAYRNGITAPADAQYPTPRRATPVESLVELKADDSQEGLRLKGNTDVELEKSLSALTQMVERAKAEKTEILVLVTETPKHAERFLKSWRTLLQELGFTGKTVQISMQQLRQRSKIETPVVVPYSLTGVESVNLSRFPNALVLYPSQPNLLLNHAKAKKIGTELMAVCESEGKATL